MPIVAILIVVNSQLQCLHRLSIRVNCKESFVWADAIYGLDAGLAWSAPEAHAQYFTRPAARILHCLDLLGRTLKFIGRKCTNWQLGRLHKLQYIKPMSIVQPCVLFYPEAIKGCSYTDQGEFPSQKNRIHASQAESFVGCVQLCILWVVESKCLQAKFLSLRYSTSHSNDGCNFEEALLSLFEVACVSKKNIFLLTSNWSSAFCWLGFFAQTPFSLFSNGCTWP